jgi:hypothetical protein
MTSPTLGVISVSTAVRRSEPAPQLLLFAEALQRMDVGLDVLDCRVWLELAI